MSCHAPTHRKLQQRQPIPTRITDHASPRWRGKDFRFCIAALNKNKNTCEVRRGRALPCCNLAGWNWLGIYYFRGSDWSGYRTWNASPSTILSPFLGNAHRRSASAPASLVSCCGIPGQNEVLTERDYYAWLMGVYRQFVRSCCRVTTKAAGLGGLCQAWVARLMLYRARRPRAQFNCSAFFLCHRTSFSGGPGVEGRSSARTEFVLLR
ncbi:hypothetical protein V8F20_008740 [Naviculisporaceae sp. PSN 640]